MADAVKDLAEGLFKLAKAVESLAQEQGNTQAQQWARRARREGNAHR